MTIRWFHISLHSLADEELMRWIAESDDERAFDELYHRYASRIMNFMYRQMHNDAQRAADLTQDLFLRIWSNRMKYRPEGSFLPWLFTIAYNLCRNEYRHNDYQKAYEQHIEATCMEETNEDFDALLDNDAFDALLQKELERMTPDARLLFSLRFEEALTVPQIALVMNLPEGTVKSRLHTLLYILRQRFKDYGNI